MRWLDTVKFKDLHPAMAMASYRVEDAYKTINAECWITSANDGKHMVGSKHYEGRALDFRTHNLRPPQDKNDLADNIRVALGPQFFVLLEDIDGPNEHLHIEYKGD